MKKKYTALAVGALLCAVGLAFWLYQILQGMVITDLRNPFSWGLYMGTFEFFISVSSGGMLLFSIAYLWRVEKLMPFAKLGSVVSLACVIAAGVAITTDLGQPFRVLKMLLYPQFGSPLFWDVVVLGLYAVVCVIAVIIQILPDTKKHRGDRKAPIQRDSRSRALSILALPMVVIMNAVTSLMFAVQNTREWWNSALVPVDSVAVAVAAGMAIMLLICALSVGRDKWPKHVDAFILMAKIAAVGLLAHLFFSVMEIVPLQWSNTPESRELLELVLGRYGWLYTLEMVLAAVAMVIFFLSLSSHSRRVAGFASLLTLVSAFAHRMMQLYPAFNAIPMNLPVTAGGETIHWTFPIATGVLEEGKDLFVRSYDYFPSLPELAVNLLPFGIVILVVALFLALDRSAEAKGA